MVYSVTIQFTPLTGTETAENHCQTHPETGAGGFCGYRFDFPAQLWIELLTGFREEIHLQFIDYTALLLFLL